jgi:hypothetical protein
MRGWKMEIAVWEGILDKVVGLGGERLVVVDGWGERGMMGG